MAPLSGSGACRKPQPTCQHALVDDARPAQEHSVAVHVTAMWRDDDDVTGHELRRGHVVIPVTAPPHSDHVARLNCVTQALLVL